ncbi:MAG: hypothetical protein ABJF23_24855 [Bryobacteraceae bacterium]
MTIRGLAGIIACVGVAASCAHPNRVSRSAVNRLIRSHESFVLVYGSLLPVGGTGVKPAIRFVHPLNSTAPHSVLHEMTVTNGGRFYAILKPPAGFRQVDLFETEVSWEKGYDKINFVRLGQRERATAMYLGEIQMTLAERRDAPGKGVATVVRDDFEAATKELHRLYPGFDGEIIKAPLLRSPVPAAVPPKRATP